MKITKVEYTVQSVFAKQNARNIEMVMMDLKVAGNKDLKYSSFIKEDGRSFVHFVMARTDEAGRILSDLDSFKKFQVELKASSPEMPPRVESLSLIDSSFDLF